MNDRSKDSKNKDKDIPDSSLKHDRGSKKVHSELDDSQEDGWKPDKASK